MNRIPCPLCGSYQHRIFWRSESYPAIGGKVVPPECSPRIPWLPLELAWCDHCQHIYQSQPPDERELDAFYEGSYVSANPSPALGGTPPRGLEIFLRAILEATGSTRGRAMEIGAYDGYFLHRLVQEGWQAVGYEPSKMGEIGRDFFNVDIHQDFYRPGKSSEVWDLVVSRYVFEHLSSPVEMLRGVWSELSAEGWLALEVPDMQSRMEVGVLGCFAHEHISYFVSSTLCSLVEAAGFTVRKLSNSRDGLMVVAQKAGRHSETPPGREAAPAGNNAALVRQFLDRREQQKSAFARELNLWDGPRNYYVYGGDSHTTDLLVERWLPASQIEMILDDDPAKQGRVAAGFSIPVVGRDRLPPPGRGLLILSAFGHHDKLYDNVAAWRAEGGTVMRFYPECRLVRPE